jgi:spermidine synthase
VSRTLGTLCFQRAASYEPRVSDNQTCLLLCRRLGAAAVGFAVASLAPFPVLAQSAADACTTENLLAGRAPIESRSVRRNLGLATDGAVSAEGAVWNADSAIILDVESSRVTYDLGAVHPLTAAFAQADANDTYELLGSEDGREGSYRPIAQLPNVVNKGHGLRSRTARFDRERVRFVRLTQARGDAFYSLAELAVYCKAPDPFLPAFRVLQAGSNAAQTDALAEREAVVRARRTNWWIAALGLALAGICTWLLGRRRGRASMEANVPPQPVPSPDTDDHASAATLDARRRERPVLLMFLASGCAALIYEVVWLHLLRLVIGASSLSVGIVLASFMGGMFAGSFGFAKWVPRTRNPLRVYAVLELGIGICGLLMPLVLPFVRSVYADVAGHGPLGIALRALIAALSLLPPTAMMGATLPAVARRYPNSVAGRSSLANLYAANTLGAVAGCLLAGFVLLSLWDVWVATFAAVFINAVIALVAWRIAARSDAPSPSKSDPEAGVTLQQPPPSAAGLEQRPAATAPNQPRAAGSVYLAAALSGLTALGAQVLWTRLLTLLFGATVYAFSIILAVFLGGLGIGAVIAARLIARKVDPLRGLAVTQLALAPALLWSAGLLAEVLPYSSPTTMTPVGALHVLHLLRAIEVMLPAAILWGMSFPFALAAVEHEDPSHATGRVYAANTAGSIIGSLAISFWAIPRIGTHGSAQLLIAVAAVSGAALMPTFVRGRIRGLAPQLGAALIMLAIGAACAALAPGVSGVFLAHGRHIWSVDAQDKYPYISEGAASTVAVHIAPDGTQHFHVAGRVEASNNPADLRLERLLGHLSALAHPHPKRVLVVGLGGGVTAGALALHPEIERLVICEIEPRVVGAARLFAHENYGVLDDPRVQVVFDDARHYLATTDERFDVITSDPIHPWVRGNSVLFSHEYYDIVKARLTPDGIATQWVPLYDTSEEAIRIQLRTFLAAFPNGSVWNSSASGRGYDVVLLGRTNARPLDVSAIAQRMAAPRIAESLREVGVQSVLDLFATYGAAASDMQGWVSGAAENRDFSLKLEYISGLSLNQQNADAIYTHMVSKRTVPRDMFVAPPATLAQLRERILAGPAFSR